MKISEELALLYGILLGDGCLSKFGKNTKATVITCSLIDDVAFFDKIVIPSLKKIKNREYNYSKRNNTNTIELKIYNRELFEKLTKIDFPVGKKGPNITISKQIEKIFYKQVIQGYFATDGCLVIANNNGTKYPRIEFASISKPLLQQV